MAPHADKIPANLQEYACVDLDSVFRILTLSALSEVLGPYPMYTAGDT